MQDVDTPPTLAGAVGAVETHRHYPPSRLPAPGPARADPAAGEPAATAGRGAARRSIRRTRPPPPRAGARPGGPGPRQAGDRPTTGPGLPHLQRYACAQTWQELVEGKWQGHRPSKLDPFKPQLQQRFQQGCTNAAAFHREITAQGYTGSYALVRDCLEQYRRAPDPIAPAPPTVREVTGWLTRHPDRLTEDELLGLKAILERCPGLQAAADHVRAFGEMLTHLRGQQLPAWITAVRADADDLPGLGSFAAGLERDLDAVTRGLTTHWSSGPIEGRVNHTKMVKRQMFGRAGLPLLRKRVLLTASRAMTTGQKTRRRR
jgi:Transposase